MKKKCIFSPLPQGAKRLLLGLLAYGRNHVAHSKMPWMHTQTQAVGFNACIREIEGS